MKGADHVTQFVFNFCLNAVLLVALFSISCFKITIVRKSLDFCACLYIQYKLSNFFGGLTDSYLINSYHLLKHFY